MNGLCPFPLLTEWLGWLVISAMKKHSRFWTSCALLALVSACHGPWSSGPRTPSPVPAPIDPQQVQDQQDMTWDDYHPIPGVNWADPSLQPKRGFKMALVAVDFPDQPFVITLPKHSDPFRQSPD